MAEVYLGIGSNQGQPAIRVQNAMAALDQHPLIQVRVCSSLYRSSPVGGIQQPDFVNAVCRVETELSPRKLLDQLQQLETEAGRVRDGVRWGPRTLDLDILLYGNRVLDDDTLVIPHARMHERAFVLYPLQEISADLDIPGQGSVAELLKLCRDQQCVRLDTTDMPDH